jgi:hypothetical protein
MSQGLSLREFPRITPGVRASSFAEASTLSAAAPRAREREPLHGRQLPYPRYRLIRAGPTCEVLPNRTAGACVSLIEVFCRGAR